MHGYQDATALADAIGDTHGATFGIYNSGGGCMLLRADINDHTAILIGSAIDGPLLSDTERADHFDTHENHGGYGVGIYAVADDGEWCRAYVSDVLADDAEAIAVLVRLAVAFEWLATDGSYVAWERGADGEVSSSRYERN